MSGHTPGPWDVYRDGQHRHIVVAGSVVDQPGGTLVADWIADIEPDATGHDEEQCEADARLIAAAPALLEALTRLYEETAEYITINHLGDVHHNVSMQMARDALAAANVGA